MATDRGRHRIEIGPVRFLVFQSDRAVLVDGREVGRVPGLPLGSMWRIPFTLDGEPARVVVDFDRGGWHWWFSTEQLDPKPPTRLVPSPALARRLDDRHLSTPALVALSAAAGLAIGLLLPLMIGGASDYGRWRGVGAAVLAFGSGAIGLPLALARLRRPDPPPWVRQVLVGLVPGDLGALAGIWLALQLGVTAGTVTGEGVTSAMVVLFGAGLVLVAATGVYAAVTQPPGGDAGPVRRAGCAVTSLGCLPIGLAMGAGGFGVLGATVHESGPFGALMLGIGGMMVGVGVAVLLLNAFVGFVREVRGVR